MRPSDRPVSREANKTTPPNQVRSLGLLPAAPDTSEAVKKNLPAARGSFGQLLSSRHQRHNSTSLQKSWKQRAEIEIEIVNEVEVYSVPQLTQLLKEPRGKGFLFAFLRKEFADESLYCLLAIEDYRNHLSQVAFENIMRRFIISNAATPVNISAKARDGLMVAARSAGIFFTGSAHHKLFPLSPTSCVSSFPLNEERAVTVFPASSSFDLIAAGDSAKECLAPQGTWERTMFNEVYDELFRLITCDSMPRFALSSLYKAYLNDEDPPVEATRLDENKDSPSSPSLRSSSAPTSPQGLRSGPRPPQSPRPRSLTMTQSPELPPGSSHSQSPGLSPLDAQSPLRRSNPTPPKTPRPSQHLRHNSLFVPRSSIKTDALGEASPSICPFNFLIAPPAVPAPQPNIIWPTEFRTFEATKQQCTRRHSFASFFSGQEAVVSEATERSKSCPSPVLRQGGVILVRDQQGFPGLMPRKP